MSLQLDRRDPVMMKSVPLSRESELPTEFAEANGTLVNDSADV